MKRRHLVVPIIVMLAAMGSVEVGDYPTMVQMESENVIMTIADDIAYVKATFNMRTQGTENEAFDVPFPLLKSPFS